MKEWSHPTAFSKWGFEEKAAMQRVLSRGQFTMAGEVRAFEREFADFHGRRHGIMVNSGSSANLLAVACLFHKREKPLQRDRMIHEEIGINTKVGDAGWKPGDTAIVPALAWSTTYAPLIQYGLRLQLVDCDDTWNAPAHYVGSVRLVVICSILGNPGYIEEWRAEAAEVGAYVIEDNCESFGARDPGGCLTGSRALLSTFSFFYSHQISAIEGGMILTDDDELADLCRMLRSHGWTRDIAKPHAFEDEYDFRLFGYNVRPLEMHAAVARAQLSKTKQFQTARFVNEGRFRDCVHDIVDLPRLRGEGNPFGLHFLCKRAEDRPRIVAALRAAGIDCRLPTGGSFPLHVYGQPWRARADTPVANDIHRRGLFLGNPPFEISKETMVLIADTIRKVYA